MDRTHDTIEITVSLPNGATWQGAVNPREFAACWRWMAPAGVRGLDEGAVRRVLGGWASSLLPGLVVDAGWSWRDMIEVINRAIDAVEKAVS